MESSYFKSFMVNVRRILLFLLICSNIPIHAQGVSINYAIKVSDTAEEDARQILEYEELLREFDKASEEEIDSEIEARGFFLKKWTKKLKKWFVKNVSKMLMKMIRFKKLKSGEHCAYEIAKFKRKTDKKLHKTGDIENLLSEMNVKTSDFDKEDLEKFKDRIRYYYHNKREKPPKNIKIRSDLENIPVRALIGGVEVACGFLIGILPFPGCAQLGWAIGLMGASHIAEGYINKIESEENKKSQRVSV